MCRVKSSQPFMDRKKHVLVWSCVWDWKFEASIKWFRGLTSIYDWLKKSSGCVNRTPTGWWCWRPMFIHFTWSNCCCSGKPDDENQHWTLDRWIASLLSGFKPWECGAKAKICCSNKLHFLEQKERTKICSSAKKTTKSAVPLLWEESLASRKRCEECSPKAIYLKTSN